MRIMLCFVFLLGLVSFGIGWLVWHYDGLKPELLFEMPIENCGMISFNTNAPGRVWATVREEVDAVCRARNFQSELRFGKYDSFFAVKGNKAKRFVPDKFHYVKGGIEFESADPNMVYFYRYRARYYPIVLQP